jgi:CBS domain-containing protein
METSFASDDMDDDLKRLFNDPQLRFRLRARLREARSAVQADAEGFEVVVHAIESVGRALNPSGRSLYGYANHIITLITGQRVQRSAEDESDPKVSKNDLETQLFLLRNTRNDFAHEGVHARQAADLAVGLSLLLEDALSTSWTNITLRDLMVRRPVVADGSDTLREVRRVMLANAFTALPVRRLDGSGKPPSSPAWKLITDAWLAKQVVGCDIGCRNKKLGARVRELYTLLPDARTCRPSMTLEELLQELHDCSLPPLLLVVTASDDSEKHSSEELLGVVAPSDLL